MAGLKQTTAKLARYRRNFEKLLAANAREFRQPPACTDGTRASDRNADFGSNPGTLRMFTYVPESCRGRRAARRRAARLHADRRRL